MFELVSEKVFALYHTNAATKECVHFLEVEMAPCTGKQTLLTDRNLPRQCLKRFVKLIIFYLFEFS